MYQGTIQSDSTALADLKIAHLKTLSAPLDAYWEAALIGFADHYEMHINSARSGYYCLNSDNQLVAFYLAQEDAHHGSDALAHIINEHSVSTALAGTNDSYFLSLCLDIAASCQVHTLLFQDNQQIADDISDGKRFSFARATEDDFSDIVKHFAATSGSMDIESIETGFDDLKGYVRSMLDEHHIFVLREEGKLIATSECRISKTQKPYADLGMIVAEEHRRKGLGTHILARTKAFCYERGVRPICSCEVDNIGSKKAIIKAGFVSRHRVVQATFDS